ncbi:MAG: hypothetical protein GX478_08935 [Erysipelotrichaceae bacterium]|jgi:hypothetical protein|nr:hypothetical protein [Erysipelotrichaceae bacterium]
MSNFEIFRRTFTFSWQRLFVYLIGIAVMIACTAAGYLLKPDDVIGLGVGFVVGLIIFGLIVHYIAYLLKAAQIAMITKAVVENELPEHVSKEGKAIVKKRFVTVSVYYAITGTINGIFGELTRGLNSLASGGGEAVEGVTSAVSALINTAVAYLCSCCLGWVFYRKDENAFKATCEGAVLYFKNWKTLIKNMGRVLGMGLVSLLIIGGLLGVGYYALFSNFPDFVSGAAQVIASASETGEEAADPTTALMIVSAMFALISWIVLHSVFVRPFVLVGVMRNYMKAGMASTPAEADMAQLDGLSKKFRKAHAKAQEQTA